MTARPVVIASRNNYLDILNEGWQQHLAPRDANAPTVISTFAGCGGSSLGYSMAGFRELLAVEWDNNAVETFALNFPDVPIYHGDIAACSVDDVLERTGLTVGALDVFDGSPPCQGFSTAGKRLLDDPRNQLFREYVRLLRGLQPKVFVMENVSGMVKGKMKLVFAECLRELKASGYRVSARLMNAMYFHVPQSRQRMIFIGVREDLGIDPSHPIVQSRPVSVGNALPWLLRIVYPGSSGYNRGTETVIDRNGVSPAVMAEGYFGDTLNGTNKYFVEAQVIGNVSYREKLQPLTLPAPTITATPPDASVSLASGGMVIEQRKFTIPEVQRIGSYPDQFRFTGSYNDQWARIGNSVPPFFMRAIAQHIRTEILGVA